VNTSLLCALVGNANPRERRWLVSVGGAYGGASVTRFLYDGGEMIAEYNASNALLRRYVRGPGADEPLVWYEGAGTGDRRWLIADQLGSIVAVTNAAGAATGSGFGINSYDEYGTPGPSNTGRFGYTVSGVPAP
jgi:hypothetical protein